MYQVITQTTLHGVPSNPLPLPELYSDHRDADDKIPQFAQRRFNLLTDSTAELVHNNHGLSTIHCGGGVVIEFYRSTNLLEDGGVS